MLIKLSETNFFTSSISAETPFLFLPLSLAAENPVHQLDPFWQLGFVVIHGEKSAEIGKRSEIAHEKVMRFARIRGKRDFIDNLFSRISGLTASSS